MWVFLVCYLKTCVPLKKNKKTRYCLRKFFLRKKSYEREKERERERERDRDGQDTEEIWSEEN